jgi:hypothetical protein
MKPVDQTILPTEGVPMRGNCFAACLASLLELPLEEVPHVMEHDNWRERTNEWLATLGLGLIEVRIDVEEPALFLLPQNMWLIATGTTRRHESRLHSVVGQSIAGGCMWQYVHDPHPDKTFLTRASHLMWLVPLDPARAIAA